MAEVTLVFEGELDQPTQIRMWAVVLGDAEETVIDVRTGEPVETDEEET